MKVVVIGGAGLIGKKVIEILAQKGHQTVSASRASGVNAMTGEGLAEALAVAEVVVDVSNSPSFEDGPVMEFFEKSGRNLMAAEKAAGVRHHVALSVVGTDRLQASGYFRAKLVQEDLIKASGIPYTIIRATQFFEFVPAIAQSGIVGNEVCLPPAMMQPISSADVAKAVAEVALGAPRNGMVELAGPERIPMDELARIYFKSQGEERNVIADPKATYFGTPVDDRSLTPDDGAMLGKTRFGEWFASARP
jgi:uncharacterized protein YbjT (DUF2867 family)